MDSMYKNSYLKCRFTDVNSRILNRAVTKALYDEKSVNEIDIYDYEPPFLRLTSEQPHIPVENIDVTRRPLAFGRLALPKLRRELHDKDYGIALAAVTSIGDLIYDPERAYEALQLNIPDRLTDLLLRPNPAMRERVINVLIILASYQEGRMAILSNQDLVNNLAVLMNDYEATIRLKVAVCLEMIARVWMAADHVINYGFIRLVLKSIQYEFSEIVEWELVILKHLLYSGRGQSIAMQNDAFNILVSNLKHFLPNIVAKSLDCLMMLTSSKQGKNMAIETDLLVELNWLIHYADNYKVFESAVSVILFCTVKTKAKHLAAEIASLPRRLVKLAENPMYKTLQMYSLKALANICEHPNIRKLVRERYLDRIRKYQVGSNEVYRETLLEIVNWVPR